MAERDNKGRFIKGVSGNPGGVPSDPESQSSQRTGRYPNRFKPGQSGNPGGRPKKSGEWEQLAKLSPARLLQLAEDESTGKNLRVDIYKWFCEMYWGKPSQSANVKADVNETVKTGMSLDEMEEIIRQAAALD